MHVNRVCLALALPLALWACESEPAVEPAAEPPAPAEPVETPELEPKAEQPTALEPPPAPEGAVVSFDLPKAGPVTGPEKDGKVQVDVKMLAEGITVEPAGAQKEGAGHHHILIDDGPLAVGTVVPSDETHLHYGKGQTEAQLLLTPGKHTLTLQFADGLHISYGPELASSIEVEVATEE